MRLGSTFLSTASLIGLTINLTPAQAATSCASLASVSLPATTISLAQSYSAGSTIVGSTKAPVDLCRIAGIIKPASDSNINFEVWLPSTGWSGRYQQVGNGGFAGSIVYSSMVPAVANFNATASTDDGSSQASSQPPGAFGASRDRLVDYGLRAVHATTENAKALIKAFYGKPQKYSYFAGCSKGGAEAMNLVQQHPNDFDGILAGAPAQYGAPMVTGFMWDTIAVAIDNPGFVPAAYISETLVPAEMAQCANAKLVQTDRFLNDPRKCRIDFKKLSCTSLPTSTCLTQPQIDGIKAVLSGPRTTRGVKLAPGYEPEFGGWLGNIISNSATPPATPTTSQSYFALGVYQYWVTPSITPSSFDIDTSSVALDEQVGPLINFTNPDLTPFRTHGGKLIQYHGFADPLITPEFSLKYYKALVEFDARRERDDPRESTAEYYRLYMVPGMGHCSGGEGPNSFGTHGGLPSGDPASDIFAALEQWVEKGISPKEIVASGTNNGVSPPVPFTRPLCPYPKKAVYIGGDTNKATSFLCNEDRADADHDHGDDDE
jgi:feruloyl esterase